MTEKPALKLVAPTVPGATALIEAEKFNVWFHDTHVLKDIVVSFSKGLINCIVGPSGGGKSTFIRSINRINDGIDGFVVQGELSFKGRNIYAAGTDVTQIRKAIGIVFQKPCVFPKSISENVLFGLQPLRLTKLEKLRVVEKQLKAVSLWKEVSHRLNDPATSLSIGQQQRLCIARTLAINPEVILLDEPTSALDPVSTRAIEELMLKLKDRYTLVFVTHNIQQAKRIADKLIFICDGQIIEQGDKDKLFNQPEHERTRIYLHDEYCEC
ncbi:MAG: phosphate ABC transporter ATP-binding protein [Methylobacter sp.]